MIQEIKIEEISVLDKKILAASLDVYGKYCQQQYVKNSDNRGYLMQFSIAQSVFHNLTQLFNTSKILKMDNREESECKRSQKLLTHSALVAISALQQYQEEATDSYIRSRCDVLWNKLESQMI